MIDPTQNNTDSTNARACKIILAKIGTILSIISILLFPWFLVAEIRLPFDSFQVFCYWLVILPIMGSLSWDYMLTRMEENR